MNGRNSEIADIESQIEAKEVQELAVSKLYTSNLLEPAFFRAKQNGIQAELGRLIEKKRILTCGVEQEKTSISETEDLYKYLNKDGGIIEDFDDALFTRFVSGIVVLSPAEIGFKLKNGLLLKERIG